ncbi:zincin [Linderina pennispora]|uniref:Zincin n=1 Tax=Linderina pennispora TaxID=61395 RepID=A0A1Y1W3H5_9FUNG|nr:zincin [Linderina pennispora]ORX68099.1 zincin [Linderina pennispora]
MATTAIDFAAYTPEAIIDGTKSLIAKGEQVYDAIAAEPNPTFATVVVPLAQFENQVSTRMAASNLRAISPDAAVRQASNDADQLLEDFKTKSGMRADVFAAINTVFENKAEMSQLDAEDARLVEHIVRRFRRNGLALSPEDQGKLAAVKSKLTELSMQKLFTREELAGLPEDFFAGRETKTEGGVDKFVVTTKYPDVEPVLQKAHSAETRRRIFVTNDERGAANIPLIKDAARLRIEAAKLLGYKTNAEYAHEICMAKTPARVAEFEAGLLSRLSTAGDKEMEDIAELKRQDSPDSPKVLAWDVPYYLNKLKETRYNVDENKVRQYLPTAHIIRQVLDFYEKLLHVHVQKADISVWHPSVDAYEVTDDEYGFLGHIYIDAYPRPDKENHPCTIPMRSGFVNADGTRHFPAAILITNLIVLHELGHVFHVICLRSKYDMFWLMSIEFDFLEAPSQMLENWVWQPEILKRFSRHYQTGESLPGSLCDAIIAAKNVGVPIDGLRRMYQSRFDQTIHNTTDVESVDITQLYSDLRRDIGRLDTGDLVLPAAGIFSHMMGGYDARFYVYMWGMVFSADMFAARFAKEGINSPQTGRDYRREILEPGATRDAADSLRAFLGRDPTDAAFFAALNV